MKQHHIHLDHPLLKHKLGYLRDKNTGAYEFRELLREISRIMAYEVMRDWDDFEDIPIETPIAATQVKRIQRPPVIVSIMRAGNGMLDAVLSMIPFASAGHIGIYRDKFIHATVEYYFKLPMDVAGRTIILCDPLLASGDTIIAAIDRLKSLNVGKIKVISLLVSSAGLKRLSEVHPDVMVYFLNIEKEMTENGYLIPGLGDAGDRLFQTK